MTDNSKILMDDIVPFTGGGVKPMVGGGTAMQQVKTEYTTAVAVQEPRKIARVTSNVLAEAKLAGASFYYRWTVKKKGGGTSEVKGGSIDCGMCIARNYGNCVIDISAEETDTHYMIKATFVDLETGFTVPRLFRQRKAQGIGGGYGNDRSEDMVFQIAQSKAQRNAILKAVPSWLIDQAIEVAQQAELDSVKAEAPAIARAKVVDFFEGYGVALERIEAAVDAKADNWTSKNIVDLRGMATALKEGRITANELFPKTAETRPKDTPFEKLVKSEKARSDFKWSGSDLDAYLADWSERAKAPTDEVMAEAVNQWDAFWSGFKTWVAGKSMAGAANEPDRRVGHQGGETPQEQTDALLCPHCKKFKTTSKMGYNRHANKCMLKHPLPSAPDDSEGNLPDEFPNVSPGLRESEQWSMLAEKLIEDPLWRELWDKHYAKAELKHTMQIEQAFNFIDGKVEDLKTDPA